jgi:FtsH-binding integral membrane protein
MNYKTVSIMAAILMFSLFLCLLVAPWSIYWLFSVPGNATADLLSRRAAMLFMGLGVISYSGRNAPHSPLRQAVSFGFALIMAGLICTGIYEYLTGVAGPGIWIAILGEAFFFVLYSVAWLSNRKD